MNKFFPKVKGTGWFFQEPYKYVWFFLFLIFLNLSYSSSISNVYSWMIITSILVWVILTAMGKRSIDLNSESGNTFSAIIVGTIFFFFFMIFVVTFTGLFQDVFSSNPTFSTFLGENSAAFLGASQPVLEGNKFVTFFVFGIMIPIIETALVIRVLELLMLIFKTKTPFGKFAILKQPSFWVSAFAVSVGMVWYHIQAKGIGSSLSLFMVFFFFLLTCMISVVPIIGKKREMESATWLHIVNNSAAVAKTVGLKFGVF